MPRFAHLLNSAANVGTELPGSLPLIPPLLNFAANIGTGLPASQPPIHPSQISAANLGTEFPGSQPLILPRLNSTANVGTGLPGAQPLIPTPLANSPANLGTGLPGSFLLHSQKQQQAFRPSGCQFLSIVKGRKKKRAQSCQYSFPPDAACFGAKLPGSLPLPSLAKLCSKHRHRVARLSPTHPSFAKFCSKPRHRVARFPASSLLG